MNSAPALLQDLKSIVGARYVRQGDGPTAKFRRGFRFGSGPCLAVVLPGTLIEQWHVLQRCAQARVAVIAQAANTGLTGGSTPDGDDYGRDVIIINTSRMNRVHLIRDGRQVVCLPGATLDALEGQLAPLGREPHSVIGSSCLGASVVGGVCNNSGGALIQRGPAYTELALYAQVRGDGSVNLVNHLGIRLGDNVLDVLRRVEEGAYDETDIFDPEGARASDQDYVEHVRDISAATPARFNADQRRLFGAAGCAGKVMVFAVRLDTFKAPAASKVIYIGTNDPADLALIRRRMLKECSHLPVSAEYLHRHCFDMARTHGKDTFIAVRMLGTRRLPALFALKARVDSWARRARFMPANVADRILFAIARLFPEQLPPRMRAFRKRFEHHLILRVADEGIAEATTILSSILPSRSGEMFECDEDEGRRALLHRFAAAGAAVRYRALHQDEIEDIVSLDMALRRNDEDWVENLPPDLDAVIAHKLYYGHFFCNVFHQDYLVRKGCDPHEIEHRIWRLLDARGARYPAEHNVGHLYPATPELRNFYRQLDPTNMLNPGIGQTSKLPHWGG